MIPDKKTDKPRGSLTYREKNARMIEQQREMLKMMMERNAISREDYAKAIKALSEKAASSYTDKLPESSGLSRRSACIILALLHNKETSFVCQGKKGFSAFWSKNRAKYGEIGLRSGRTAASEPDYLLSTAETTRKRWRTFLRFFDLQRTTKRI